MIIFQCENILLKYIHHSLQQLIGFLFVPLPCDRKQDQENMQGRLAVELKSVGTRRIPWNILHGIGHQQMQLISENAAPKKVWLDHPWFVKYSLQSFGSPLNKVKGEYQFHNEPLTKNPPPKADVEEIKKGPVGELSLCSVQQQSLSRKKSKVRS